jgi:serine protease Do
MRTQQTGTINLRLVVAALALVVMSASVAILVANNVRADVPRGQVASTRDQAPAIAPTRVAPLAGMQDAFTAIADRLEPSLVAIRVKKTIRTAGLDDSMPGFQFLFPDTPGLRFPRSTTPRQFNSYGAGSGVIVRSDGWILTNDHVVEGADKVTVTLHDGRELEGKVRRDYRSDLAAVKIDATGLTAVEFGDSDRVKVGQWAIAFGSPFELNDTMTVGIISARSRQKQIQEGTQGRFYPALFQTDASINPGNSGGPLVDIYGRVIGINVAINSPNGGSVGIAFAIPSNSARNIVEQLIDKGTVTRGYLGVFPRALTVSDRQRYGVPKGGALIESVSDNTPASRAGLQVEDVVEKIDGKLVEDDVHFRSMIAGIAPGKRVDLTVRRGGRDVTVPVNLEAAPPPNQASATQPAETSDANRIGIKTQAITPDVAQRYKLGDGKSGVLVTQVEDASAADEAGLKAGDVVLKANGRAVSSPSDLAKALNPAKSGEDVPLVVLRDKTRFLLSVRIP